MTEQEQSNLGKLAEAAAEFRKQERAMHLALEDQVAKLVEWSKAALGVGDEDVAPSVILEELDDVVQAIEGKIEPILGALRTLRAHPGAAVQAAAEATERSDSEPPLFVGGTVSPIRKDESLPGEPVNAARDHLFRAHFDGPGDGDELREDVVGAFEAYHRELWATLAREGIFG